MPVGIMVEPNPDMVLELRLWQRSRISRPMHHQGDMLLGLLVLTSRNMNMINVLFTCVTSFPVRSVLFDTHSSVLQWAKFSAK